jgi:hypothetical protein
MLMFNREVNLPVDLIHPVEREHEAPCHIKYAQWVKEAMKYACECARIHASPNLVRQAKHYNLNARTPNFKVGDNVWLFYMPHAVRKFKSDWKGPFLIVEIIDDVRYKLMAHQDGPKRVVHVSQLKEYKGNDPIISWLDEEEEESLPTVKGPPLRRVKAPHKDAQPRIRAENVPPAEEDVLHAPVQKVLYKPTFGIREEENTPLVTNRAPIDNNIPSLGEGTDNPIVFADVHPVPVGHNIVVDEEHALPILEQSEPLDEVISLGPNLDTNAEVLDPDQDDTIGYEDPEAVPSIRAPTRSEPLPPIVGTRKGDRVRKPKIDPSYEYGDTYVTNK